MTGTEFLEFAKKHEVEMWREGERIRYRARAGKVTQKAVKAMQSLRNELLPLLEERTPAPVEEVTDPYPFDALVGEYRQGRRHLSDVLHLLENPDVDDSLKECIRQVMTQKALEARELPEQRQPSQLEQVGDFLTRVAGEGDLLAKYADLIARAERGELAKGREIALCAWERCEDLNHVVLFAVERYHRLKRTGSKILGYVASAELITLHCAKEAQKALEAEGVA